MRFHARLLGAVLALLAGILAACALAQAQGAGDPVKGKKVFAKCQACHSLDADVNKIGPSLHGIVGRAAAADAAFKYSDAMKNAQLNWTPETLDQYLLNPRKMVPGTKMAFAGLPKEQDRADVIAYLQQSAGPAQ